jgi:hypothetical protein
MIPSDNRDFGDSLREAFRNSAAPVDETFAERIDARVGWYEHRRGFALVLAAVAAVALIVMMIVGVGLASPGLAALLGQDVTAPPPYALDILSLVVPVAGLLLAAALTFPILRARK